MSNQFSLNNNKLNKNAGKPSGMGYTFGMNENGSGWIENGVDSSLNHHIRSFNQHAHHNKSVMARKQYSKVHHNSALGKMKDGLNNSHNNPLATQYSNCDNASHPRNSNQNSNYQSFHPNNIQSHTSKMTTKANSVDKKKHSLSRFVRSLYKRKLVDAVFLDGSSRSAILSVPQSWA